MDSAGAISGNSANSCGYGKICNRPGVRGVCPYGWHLPTKAEWETLLNYVGETNEDIDKRLKATTGWSKSNAGTDDYSFTVIPTGYLDYWDEENDDHLGEYEQETYSARFWSSTEQEDGADEQKAKIAHLVSFGNTVYYPLEARAKKLAISVRCIQD